MSYLQVNSFHTYTTLISLLSSFPIGPRWLHKKTCMFLFLWKWVFLVNRKFLDDFIQLLHDLTTPPNDLLFFTASLFLQRWSCLSWRFVGGVQIILSLFQITVAVSVGTFPPCKISNWSTDQKVWNMSKICREKPRTWSSANLHRTCCIQNKCVHSFHDFLKNYNLYFFSLVFSSVVSSPVQQISTETERKQKQNGK